MTCAYCLKDKQRVLPIHLQKLGDYQIHFLVLLFSTVSTAQGLIGVACKSYLCLTRAFKEAADSYQRNTTTNLMTQCDTVVFCEAVSFYKSFWHGCDNRALVILWELSIGTIPQYSLLAPTGREREGVWPPAGTSQPCTVHTPCTLHCSAQPCTVHNPCWHITTLHKPGWHIPAFPVTLTLPCILKGSHQCRALHCSTLCFPMNCVELCCTEEGCTTVVDMVEIGALWAEEAWGNQPHLGDCRRLSCHSTQTFAPPS